MIVLGIDPGIRRVGYAAVEISGGEFRVLDFDVLRVDQVSESLGQRLEFLHEEIAKILRQWNPRWVGLEKAVNFKNVDSAFKLTEARGVLRLALYQELSEADSRLIELSPTAIKKESTGSGQSSKTDLERMMKLRIPQLETWVEENGKKLTHDAYDALAIAWTTWKKVERSRRVARVARTTH